MIINLRGTNGAGKSTIVHAMLQRFTKRSIYITGRRKPLGYILNDNVFILGHYEIKNGGMDTIKSLDEAYAIINEYATNAYDVLYEGKNMSDNPTRLIELSGREEVHVIIIDHPVEECIHAVRERGHRIAEATIRRLAAKTDREILTFITNNIPVHVEPRQEAFELCLELLGLE